VSQRAQAASPSKQNVQHSIEDLFQQRMLQLYNIMLTL
jgi:hypothetical protein